MDISLSYKASLLFKSAGDEDTSTSSDEQSLYRKRVQSRIPPYSYGGRQNEDDHYPRAAQTIDSGQLLLPMVGVAKSPW